MSERISFEEYCDKVKNLHWAKKLPILEFKEKARKAYNKKYGKIEKEEITQIESVENEVGSWLGQEEAKEATRLYDNYKEGKEITEFADVELLKRLVSFEIEVKRIQTDINTKRLNTAEGKVYNPNYAINAIEKLTEQILLLRRSLGLSEEQKTKDPLSVLKDLFRRALLWRQKNRVSFESRCEHCKKMNLLRIRTKHYDSYKHPFYRDKVLCNDRLWELWREGKITKEDIGKILEVSSFYADWVEEKIYGSSSQSSALLESGDEESGSD